MSAGITSLLTLQYFAWFIALVALVIGLYTLVINPRHPANRHVSFLLLLIAAQVFAIGSMINNVGVESSAAILQATLPAMLLVATTLARQPVLLLVIVVLLKPDWLIGSAHEPGSLEANRTRRFSWRWIWWLVYAFIPLIFVLVFLDAVFATNGSWLPQNLQLYLGGSYDLSANYSEALRLFQSSSLGIFLQSLIRFLLQFSLSGFGLIKFVLLVFLLARHYLSRRANHADQSGITQSKSQTALTDTNRKLAQIILAAEILAILVTIGGSFLSISSLLSLAISGIIVCIIYVAVYAYASFRQMISERRTQHGSIQRRLTALILIVVVPITAGTAFFLIERARSQIEEDAAQNLAATNAALTNSVSTWLDFNLKALQNMAEQPALISMDTERQEPVLQALARAYPYMYLVSTTDLNGINVARNDEVEPKDYGGRTWFLDARDGNPVSYQTVIGATSNQPALVASVPIRALPASIDPNAEIVGVAMYAADLDAISEQVKAARSGSEGGSGAGLESFVIDEKDQVIAHTSRQATGELTILSNYPPVQALRSGVAGPSSFTDDDGQKWRAYLQPLSNGWGVIVQQPEEALLEPVRNYQRIAWITLLIGASLLAVMTYLTIRQSIRPIQTLTEIASEIAASVDASAQAGAGEITLLRQAPVESDDELGTLARSFNAMTSQLNGLIGKLEERVAERTQALERRAIQFQVTADVAREAAAIRQTQQVMEHIVNLISERFGFYHAGIFLLDNQENLAAGGVSSAEYAVLRAASSEGGQRMLARNHKLKVGEVGIVGYVAARGEPRIALDVGGDAVFFNNPDLPLTRSEMALPLIVHQQIIGVLDVQSPEPQAFTQEDIEILQILADQIALAIENARLLSQSQQAYQEVERLYRGQVRQGWRKRLQGSAQAAQITYAFLNNTFTGTSPSASATVTADSMTDSIVSADGIHSEQVRRLDSAPSLRSLETVFGAGDREAPAARPDKERPVETAAGALHPQNNEYTVKLPIHLRGQRLGSLVLRRGSSIGPWQDDEKDLLQQTLGQLALALENARLLEEVQRRASYEETINRIIGKVQSSLNLDNVMRSAVQEIGRALNASKVQIRINPESTGDSIESPPNPTGAPPEPAAFPDLQAISTVISGAAAAADILQRTPEEAPSVRTRGARRTRVRPADRRSPTEAAADAARDASEASHSAPPEYPGHE